MHESLASCCVWLCQVCWQASVPAGVSAAIVAITGRHCVNKQDSRLAVPSHPHLLAGSTSGHHSISGDPHAPSCAHQHGCRGSSVVSRLCLACQRGLEAYRSPALTASRPASAGHEQSRPGRQPEPARGLSKAAGLMASHHLTRPERLRGCRRITRSQRWRVEMRRGLGPSLLLARS